MNLFFRFVLLWLPLPRLVCCGAFFLISAEGRMLCVLSNEEVNLLFVCRECFAEDAQCNMRRQRTVVAAV